MKILSLYIQISWGLGERNEAYSFRSFAFYVYGSIHDKYTLIQFEQSIRSGEHDE